MIRRRASAKTISGKEVRSKEIIMGINMLEECVCQSATDIYMMIDHERLFVGYKKVDRRYLHDFHKGFFAKAPSSTPDVAYWEDDIGEDSRHLEALI